MQWTGRAQQNCQYEQNIKQLTVLEDFGKVE